MSNLSRFSALIIFAVLSTVTTTAAARLLGVCVGINEFPHNSAEPLKFAQSDATAVAEFLKSATPDASITLLRGDEGTKANILEALTEAAQAAEPDDVIIFYYSGHGVDGGMLAYDTKYRSSMLAYRDISDIFKASKVQNKIIFADTCHSGTGRLSKPANKNSQYLATQNILLFLSSRSNELSMENITKGGGVFTRHLLEGLKGGADANSDDAVTARELYDYVSTRVTRETSQMQHPVMWGNFNPEMIMMQLNAAGYSE